MTSKTCHYCGQPYERPQRITDHNWSISLYCCPDHQKKQGNLNASKRAREDRPKFKFCPDCKTEKHVSQFNTCRGHADGLQTYCKTHQAKRHKPKAFSYGNSDLERDMLRTIHLKPLLSRTWL